MIAKLIAIIMCIVSVFPGPLPMLFSEMELKYELSQGNYESPYIVRPLDGITVVLKSFLPDLSTSEPL